MIQRNPVGWVVDWPLAWLLTYNGVDCELWRYVLEKCMESKICREVLALLQSIGLDIKRHKCYAEPAEIEAEAEQAKPPSNASTTTTQASHPNPQNRLSPLDRLSPRNKHLLKHSKTKLLNCLVNPQNHPELLPGSWVGLPPTPPS
jgi:hypothetical protein